MLRHSAVRPLALAAFALTAGMLFSGSSQAASSLSVNSCVGSNKNKVVKCCEQQMLISPYWRNMANSGRCEAATVCVKVNTGRSHSSVLKRCYIRGLSRWEPDSDNTTPNGRRNPNSRPSANRLSAGPNGPK